MRRLGTTATATLALVAALASCADTDETTDGNATTEPTTAATTSEPAATETTAPAEEPTTEEPTTDQGAADAGVTGLGATRAAWDANHEQAPGYTEGAAYLPMVRDDQPKYAAVCCDDQIVTYLLMLADGTSLDQAQVEVANELPTDATPGEVVDKDGGCTMQLWESATLQDAIGANAIATYFMDEPDLPSVTMSTGDSVDELQC